VYSNKRFLFLVL